MSNEPLIIADLDNIFVAEGISVASATNEQFITWAESLVAFEVSEEPDSEWPLQHRLNYCNYVAKMGIDLKEKKL